MIDEIRRAVRLTTQEFDCELMELEEAAKLDLQIAGVITDSMDSLVKRAILTYCRMNFGTPENYDQLKRSYDEQKAQLSMASGYTDWGTGENA